MPIHYPGPPVPHRSRRERAAAAAAAAAAREAEEARIRAEEERVRAERVRLGPPLVLEALVCQGVRRVKGRVSSISLLSPTLDAVQTIRQNAQSFSKSTKVQ